MKFKVLLFVLILSAVLPEHSYSQDEAVRVIVKDESGQPLSKASVAVDNNPLCVTDREGTGTFVPSRKLHMPFKIKLEKKGYEVKEFTYFEDDSEIEVIAKKSAGKDFTYLYVFKENDIPLQQYPVRVQSKEYLTDAAGRVKVPFNELSPGQVNIKDYEVIGSKSKGGSLYLSVKKALEEALPISELVKKDLTKKELEEIVYKQYKNDFESVTSAIIEERQRLEENNVKIREEIIAITERLKHEKNLSPERRKELQIYMSGLEKTLKENSIAFKKSEEKTLLLLERLQRIIHAKDSVHQATVEKFQISEKQRIAVEKKAHRNLVVFSIIIFALLLLAVVFYSIANKLKRQKKSLVKSNEELTELKHELSRKMVEIREQKERIEDKNKELDMFVYKASHDIKGPLRSLLGLTDVGIKTISDKNALEIFGHIHKSISKLDRLLSDLLQLSKAKSARIVKTNINLKDNILAVMDSFKNSEKFDTVTVHLDIPDNYQMNTDPNFFYSILQNFIENAIKYSDPRKKDSFLKISLKEKKDKTLLIFEDNGIGIGKDSVSRVFDMFYKAHEGTDGTGLGLYLVKHNLEKLGGKLSVESKLGQGSVFTVEFPQEASKVEVVG